MPHSLAPPSVRMTGMVMTPIWAETCARDPDTSSLSVSGSMAPMTTPHSHAKATLQKGPQWRNMGEVKDGEGSRMKVGVSINLDDQLSALFKKFSPHGLVPTAVWDGFGDTHRHRSACSLSPPYRYAGIFVKHIFGGELKFEFRWLIANSWNHNVDSEVPPPSEYFPPSELEAGLQSTSSRHLIEGNGGKGSPPLQIDPKSDPECTVQFLIF